MLFLLYLTQINQTCTPYSELPSYISITIKDDIRVKITRLSLYTSTILLWDIILSLFHFYSHSFLLTYLPAYPLDILALKEKKLSYYKAAVVIANRGAAVVIANRGAAVL